MSNIIEKKQTFTACSLHGLFEQQTLQQLTEDIPRWVYLETVKNIYNPQKNTYWAFFSWMQNILLLVMEEGSKHI